MTFYIAPWLCWLLGIVGLLVLALAGFGAWVLRDLYRAYNGLTDWCGWWG